MLGTLRCLRCQPAVRSWPTVGHTLQSGHGLGRQSGRLRATGQKAQLELEVELLQQTVDALRRAAEAERLRADEARLRADAERRAAEAERQKADEARQKADLIEQSLRTELAFVRGTLNMQGELGACCWLLLSLGGTARPSAAGDCWGPRPLCGRLPAACLAPACSLVRSQSRCFDLWSNCCTVQRRRSASLEPRSRAQNRKPHRCAEAEQRQPRSRRVAQICGNCCWNRRRRWPSALTRWAGRARTRPRRSLSCTSCSASMDTTSSSCPRDEWILW